MAKIPSPPSLKEHYYASNEVTTRTIAEFHSPDSLGQMARSRENYHDEIIRPSKSETDNDALIFFKTFKPAMAEEYKRDLCDSIGVQAQLTFYTSIHEWSINSINSSAVQRLKASIRDYIATECGNRAPRVKKSHLISGVKASLNTLEIGEIVKITELMVNKYIYQWIKSHPDGCSIAMHDIYFRRGIALNRQLEDRSHFEELDYISSYSLSLSVAETFSRSANGFTTAPTLIHSDLPTIAPRAIFFSPFISDMSAEQLELGVIPPLTPNTLIYSATYDGVHDYVVEPVPFRHPIASEHPGLFADAPVTR